MFEFLLIGNKCLNVIVYKFIYMFRYTFIYVFKFGFKCEFGDIVVFRVKYLVYVKIWCDYNSRMV